MSTVSRQPQARKGRSCQLVAKEGDLFLVSITTADRQTDFYICRQDLDCPDGLLFKLEKQHPTEDRTVETYWTRLDEFCDLSAAVCDCKGFCFKQQPCRHILALSACREAGKLPVADLPPTSILPDCFRELGRDPIPGYDDEPSCGSTDWPWDVA
jgi:SWIM zinc finger